MEQRNIKIFLIVGLIITTLITIFSCILILIFLQNYSASHYYGPMDKIDPNEFNIDINSAIPEEKDSTNLNKPNIEPNIMILNDEDLDSIDENDIPKEGIPLQDIEAPIR